MKVLVMGGNRYIGMQLVHELVRAGHEVTVLNSHETPLPSSVKRLHGNRHEAGLLHRVLGPISGSFDAVFDNTAYTPEHLLPMVDLFRGRVTHFVFTSSIALYEMAPAQPIDESGTTGSVATRKPPCTAPTRPARCIAKSCWRASTRTTACPSPACVSPTAAAR